MAPTVAHALALAVKRHGVTDLFGQSLPSAFFLAAARHGLRQVSYRTENAGGAMADGYARITGKVAVVGAQNGPAATLLVAPFAEALKASVPIVGLVQDAPRPTRDRNAFQELDHFELFRGCTKWVRQLTDPARVDDYVDMAFTAAASGRPGPAVLLLPKDLLVEEDAPPLLRRTRALGRFPLDRPRASADAVTAAARLLAGARRPLVVAGGGVHLSARWTTTWSTIHFGTDRDGAPVYLRDIWPSEREVAEIVSSSIDVDQFERSYADVLAGDGRWQTMSVLSGDTFDWDESSTYVRRPPYFDGFTVEPPGVPPVTGARVLAPLGDSVTTDHISPAGSIRADSPAGRYLTEHGVAPRDFNSYGSRRGNHEVMVRGTFANVRLRNRLVPGSEGGVTRNLLDNTTRTIFEAAEAYRSAGVPLLVIAGKEYGTGSSRDWAAKGTALLGVRVVLAESYERIHRSNLVGMGVVPLRFMPGENAEALGLTGHEVFALPGLSDLPEVITVQADDRRFRASLAVETPTEREYLRNGGILPFVLRSLR